MNVSELKLALKATTNNRIVPLIWGSQGIGKTSVVKQFAQENGYESVVHLCLGSQDVGDLVGLLSKNPDGVTVSHSRPDWFKTEGKHVIFLDEINRAHPDVLQAMFTFILEGKLHTHVLSKDSVIVAAANYNNNNFNVTDMSDAAWMNRFIHVDFKPTLEDFVVHADNIGQPVIADFIRDNPHLISDTDQNNKFDFAQVKPTRRSLLDFIGKLESDTNVDITNIKYELYSGAVGSIAASLFVSNSKKYKDKLTAKDLLNYSKKTSSKVKSISTTDNARLDMLSSAFEEVLLVLKSKGTITKEQDASLKSFLLDAPLEFGFNAIKRIKDELPVIIKAKFCNDYEFAKKYEAVKNMKG